jgi:hypothetical protein
VILACSLGRPSIKHHRAFIDLQPDILAPLHRPESITGIRFSLAGDLFAVIIRLVGCVSRNNETDTLAIVLKDHEGNFVTKLTVLVYWKQARPQELFPAALILCTTSELRPIVSITPLLLEEESTCGYIPEAFSMVLG